MDKKKFFQSICFIALVATMTITLFDVELFPAYERAAPSPSPLPEGKEERSAGKSLLVDGLPQKVCRGPDGDQQPTCCVEYLPIDTLPYGLNVFGQPKDFGHFVGQYLEFNSYRSMADYVYVKRWPIPKPLNYVQLNPEKIAPCLLPGTILHVTTGDTTDFFTDFHPHIKVPYVLVTGDTDFSAPGPHAERLKDDNLIVWYGQNSDIESQHPKFIPIPLGISQWLDGPAALYNFEEELRTIPKRKLVLQNSISHGDDFKVSAERARLTRIIETTMSHFVDSFTKEIMGGHLPTLYKTMAQYKFIFSPPGAGLDCYRTWEALYVRTIPIVLSNTLNPVYDDLPVLMVEKWEDVTPQFLNEKWEEMLGSRSGNKTYKWEKLYRPYWQREFNQYRRKMGQQHTTIPYKLRYTEVQNL